MDAVVCEDRSLVFIEVAAKRFNLTNTIIDGSIGSLEEDLEQMVVGKAKQLESSISAFWRGELPMIPLKPGSCKQVFSVLLLQEFPQFAALRRYAVARVADANIQLQNLQFMTIDELEMLEGLLSRGYRLSDILKAKCRSVYSSEMSLTNFMLTKKPNLSLEKPAAIEKAQRDWYLDRMSQFANWGLDLSDFQA